MRGGEAGQGGARHRQHGRQVLRLRGQGHQGVANCCQLLPTIANYTLQFRYSLYSTTSCFSCRAFFRRSLVGGKFETFSCRSLGEARQCQVTAANRKKCQACR